MINQGATFVNCPVTAKDIVRANNIFGPDLASVLGKKRKVKIKVPPVEFIPREISMISLLFVNSNLSHYNFNASWINNSQ